MINFLTTNRLTAEMFAENMYQMVKGRILEVREVDVMFADETTGAITCEGNDPYIKIKVLETSREDRSKRWIDDNLDSTWDVEIVEPHPKVPSDIQGAWIYNPYCFVLTEGSNIVLHGAKD